MLTKERIKELHSLVADGYLAMFQATVQWGLNGPEEGIFACNKLITLSTQLRNRFEGKYGSFEERQNKGE